MKICPTATKELPLEIAQKVSMKNENQVTIAPTVETLIASKILRLIVSEIAEGRFPTGRSLRVTAKQKIGLAENKTRDAVAHLKETGRVQEETIPDRQKGGGAWRYLKPTLSADEEAALLAEPDLPLPVVMQGPNTTRGIKLSAGTRALVEKLYGDRHDDINTVMDALMVKAMSGDLPAIEMVMKRVIAPLKPRTPHINLELDVNAALSEQAKHVLQAVVTGQLDPDTGASLINSITHFAKLRETDELTERLARIEAALLLAPGGEIRESKVDARVGDGMAEARGQDRARADLAARWEGATRAGL